MMATFTIKAVWYTLVASDTFFDVEARTKQEALTKARKLVQASQGKDTDLIEWQGADELEGGEFEVAIEEDE
jgi:hypothetical protein